MQTELSKEQREALNRFVADCRKITRHDERGAELAAERLGSFAACINAGVPRSVLTERSGLARSRIYQLMNQLEEE